MRSLRLPWLVPMRIAVPCSLQMRTSGVKRSRMRSSSSCVFRIGVLAHIELLLVGVVAGVHAHLLHDAGGDSAALGVKWMSATKGV
jgi:hypothetical protein